MNSSEEGKRKGFIFHAVVGGKKKAFLTMGKRALRKRINGLLRRVKEHTLKIKKESAKLNPDHSLINHWVAEVKAFQKSIESAQKRLGE